MEKKVICAMFIGMYFFFKPGIVFEILFCVSIIYVCAVFCMYPEGSAMSRFLSE